MMDTSPLWLSHTLIAAVSFTAGVAVASLWWRHRCERVHADEVERRVDIARRLYRLERGEPGGGKSRLYDPPDSAHLVTGGYQPKPGGGPRNPPCGGSGVQSARRINPHLSNRVLEGGRPAGWAQKMIDAERVAPVDAGGRPLPPLPDVDVDEPWQKAERPKPPPGPREPLSGRPPPSGDWYLTQRVPEDRRR
jgi:hypothetical protein